LETGEASGESKPKSGQNQKKRHEDDDDDEDDEEGGGEEVGPDGEKRRKFPKRKVAVLLGYCGTGYQGMQM